MAIISTPTQLPASKGLCVSCGCHSKSPQRRSPKTAGLYSQAASSTGGQKFKVKVSIGPSPLPQKALPCLPRPLVAARSSTFLSTGPSLQRVPSPLIRTPPIRGGRTHPNLVNHLNSKSLFPNRGHILRFWVGMDFRGTPFSPHRRNPWVNSESR